jgi:cobalt-zinc-cadmium efflux system outer membrane protein
MLPPPAPAPCPRALTLTDLENLALANNPTLASAAAQVLQQQGLTRQAGLYPNPTVGYLRTDPDQPGQSQTSGVFLSQDIVTAGKRRLARAAGRQEIARADWQLQAQRLRVLNDVRIRFYEVLGAQQAVRAAQDLEGLAVEGVQVAQQLLKERHGTRPDVLQAEIQLSAVRSSLEDARLRHEAAWRQLAAVAGAPHLPPAPLAGALDSDLPQLEWEPSVQQLLASSPLLLAQQAEIRASEQELRLAKAQAVPNLNVQVVAQRDHVMKFSSVSTLVSVPLPIFNRNQGNITAAEGRLIQQHKEYERIQLALVDQLANSFRQYLSLRTQAARLQKEILPRARENLELTTEAYKLGRFDFLRVLSARQVYFQTSLSAIDTLTALHKTAIEIQGLQLTGGLNPTEAGTALQAVPGAVPSGVRSILLQQAQEQRGGGSLNLPGAVQAGAP